MWILIDKEKIKLTRKREIKWNSLNMHSILNLSRPSERARKRNIWTCPWSDIFMLRNNLRFCRYYLTIQRFTYTVKHSDYCFIEREVDNGFIPMNESTIFELKEQVGMNNERYNHSFLATFRHFFLLINFKNKRSRTVLLMKFLLFILIFLI